MECVAKWIDFPVRQLIWTEQNSIEKCFLHGDTHGVGDTWLHAFILKLAVLT